MLDERLVRYINEGRCFALVGAGPSIEKGYPDWYELAQKTYEIVSAKGLVTNPGDYEKFLKERRYPELFRLAERELGGRGKLIEVIESILHPASDYRGRLYELLAKWPFACYLTTNYDDELYSYLRDRGIYFQVCNNQKSDFLLVRDNVSNLILKLHSDLKHPKDLILTSEDYSRYYFDSSKQYFRDELKSIFVKFNLLIIGLSLSDPGISYILKLAKEYANPEHPIFMLATGFTQAEESELFEQYSIVLINYNNEDGKHQELLKTLRVADKFIAPRSFHGQGIETITTPEEETSAAISLYLYTRLQDAEGGSNLAPLILSVLQANREDGMTIDEIVSSPSMKAMGQARHIYDPHVKAAVEDLVNNGLAVINLDTLSITERGEEKVQESRIIRETERELAYGQFELTLRESYKSISESQIPECRVLAEDSIVSCFDKRGLVIANRVFGDQKATGNELTDIFGLISKKARSLSDPLLIRAFIDAMHQFLIEPSSRQKTYLASVSQGFFLYHMLGLDPSCSLIRQDIFSKTLWFCDSSVLLPLIAVGCHNHEFAVELFTRLISLGASLHTTKKLLREVRDHFNWAVDFVDRAGESSAEFLRAALIKGSFKQNLFLDGYIRLSADRRVSGFNDYIDLVHHHLPGEASLRGILLDYSIIVEPIEEVNGFDQALWGDINDVQAQIYNERSRKGNYRSSLQIEAEAEIWLLVNRLRAGQYKLLNDCTAERFYFVSQSRVIDDVFKPDAVVTWTSDALYRYISSLPQGRLDPELLQQCMLQEYYYAGISFIDKERYTRFFERSIDASKMRFSEQRSRYIHELEIKSAANFDDAFNLTPDLEKPLFVTQMEWRMAEKARQREEQAKIREAEAKIETNRLRATKTKAQIRKSKLADDQEKSRSKNLQDPRHLRKRKRQSKERAKKKRK